jgi:hypothetical protein
VWQDNQGRASNDIFYKGNTIAFYPFVDVTRTNAGTSANPAVATSGNNMYIVWEDDTSGNFEILYRRSTDGGANFGENGVAINLSNNAGTSTIPFVAASGNNVYIVWEDDTSGNFEILYRKSTDGGASFDATINLSNNAGFSTNSAIAVSGDNLYVVWHDNNDTPVNEILYRRSSDGGASFNAVINLSNNAGSSNNPDVAAINNLPV